MSYYVSLRPEFRVVMSVTISAYKRCSVPLYRQLFVGGFMSYLRYVCLFGYSSVQHIWCCVFLFLCLVHLMLPVYLDCPFLIVPLVFSNVYIQWNREVTTEKYSIIQTWQANNRYTNTYMYTIFILQQEELCISLENIWSVDFSFKST